MSKAVEHTLTINGEPMTAYRIDNDVNGNPRYVVHFTSLGIELGDYGRIPGLKRYRAKWFGGGYVFQSYNLESDIQWALNQVDKFYKVREVRS